MHLNTEIQISAFYRFVALKEEQIELIRQQIEEMGKTENFRGLVLLGSEGINGTVSGPSDILNHFKSLVRDWVQDPNLVFKDSFSSHHPFHELKVKVKPEIVTLNRPGMVPTGINNHLSPEEWHKMMEQEDVIILDTRNNYETKMGKFKNAIEMEITDFHDFPERLKQISIPPEKKVMIYCTGGIRCEKAILEMREQGLNEVYQLDGGILNYIKEYPRQKFEGECFVFDYRVAVDQELQPTQTYKLCPHCGQPAKTKIECAKCGTEALVCEECLSISADKKTCSKNCAHHYRIDSRSNKPQTVEMRRRQPN